MPTEYFTPTDIPAFARARSDLLDAVQRDLDAAFGKLPSVANTKQGSITYVASDTGAADAYAVAMPYTQAAYADGLAVNFVPANTNTGASTINVDSLGAKAIRRPDGTALVAGDLVAGQVACLRYDAVGGYFRFDISVPLEWYATKAYVLAAVAAGGVPSALPVTSLGVGTATALQLIRINAAGTGIEGYTLVQELISFDNMITAG